MYILSTKLEKVLTAAEVEEIFQIILANKRLAREQLEESPLTGLNWFEEYSSGGIMYHPDTDYIGGVYERFG
jgi:hypothetical protein